MNELNELIETLPEGEVLIETLLEDFVLIETLWNEFDSYDYEELLSDTNYDNSHFTNQDQPSEGE